MNRAHSVLAATVLAALASLIVLAAAGAGLSAIPGETPGAVRVVLGEANATWQALEGSPTIDGSPAPKPEQPIPDDGIEPWRGYERTVSMDLGGEGSVLVLADGVGLVLEVPDVDEEGADEDAAGANGTDGTDPSPPFSNASSTGRAGAGSQAPASTSEGEGSTDGEGDTAPAPQDHRSDASEDEGRWGLSERPVWAAGLALAVVLAAAPTAWRLITRDEDSDKDARLPGERPRPGDRGRNNPHRRRTRDPSARGGASRERRTHPERRDERGRGTSRRTRPRGAEDRERLRR